jgi:hypothetical protein
VVATDAPCAASHVELDVRVLRGVLLDYLPSTVPGEGVHDDDLPGGLLDDEAVEERAYPLLLVADRHHDRY